MAKWRDDKLNGPLAVAGETGLQFTPYPPSEDLQFFVEHYWVLRWDMRSQPPFRSEHLPDPSVHLIVEDDISGIFGPARGRFSRLVEGAGWAFCVKFRPGAFYPFLGSPVSGLKNRTVDLSTVFGDSGQALEAGLRATGGVEEQIELAEDFLRGRRPAHNDLVALIHQMIACIVDSGEITRSRDLEVRFNLTRRTLQRLFSRYVGASPSWVIRRYRIHDAVDRLEGGEIVDWPALAAALGYFDQAHFIKDFKAMIGVTPGSYAHRMSHDEQM
jgi:AraC-like DNA-binding protein